MADQNTDSTIRWTWGAEELRWYRKPQEGDHKQDIVFREGDDYTPREKDISDSNLLKQWLWINKNETSDKTKSKNSLVKRIPALWSDDDKKTRNHVDGRLRSLKRLLLNIAEDAGKTAKDLPDDLSWWRAKSMKSNAQKAKSAKNKRLKNLLFPSEKK